MTATITNAFQQQFGQTFYAAAQQMDSRLASVLIDKGTITGESFTVNALSAAQDTPQDTTRHGDTVWSDISHSTRVALMLDYFDALPIDRADIPKLVANPSGKYIEALRNGWNRRKDKVIYNALRGSAQAKDGSTSALPSGQKIAHGSAGINKTKILSTLELFRANENDAENGRKLYFLYNSAMISDILADTTLTSADYMAVKMIQEGGVAKNWAGFTWIPYNGLYTSGGVTYTVAFADNALEHGTGFMEARVDIRADKKNTWQCSLAASFGAVRREDVGVVEVAFQ